MKKWIVLTSMFAVSVVAAAELVYDDKTKFEIVKAAIQYNVNHSINANDLSNMSSRPNLNPDAAINFGTTMTLHWFDCSDKDIEDGQSGFECRVEAQYCYERNQYPPTRVKMVITGTESL